MDVGSESCFGGSKAPKVNKQRSSFLPCLSRRRPLQSFVVSRPKVQRSGPAQGGKRRRRRCRPPKLFFRRPWPAFAATPRDMLVSHQHQIVSFLFLLLCLPPNLRALLCAFGCRELPAQQIVSSAQFRSFIMPRDVRLRGCIGCCGACGEGEDGAGGGDESAASGDPSGTNEKSPIPNNHQQLLASAVEGKSAGGKVIWPAGRGGNWGADEAAAAKTTR